VLIDLTPPPLDCIGQNIDMSVFLIKQPHTRNLHVVCCLVECRLLPHIDRVIIDQDDMFIVHYLACQLCKGHLDNISALLLFNHLELASLKEDNTDLILG
jgi:hypothetical protein